MSFTVTYPVKRDLPTPTETAVINFINECLDIPTQRYSRITSFNTSIINPRVDLSNQHQLKTVAREKYGIIVELSYKTHISHKIQLSPMPPRFCGPLSKLQLLQQRLSELPDGSYEAAHKEFVFEQTLQQTYQHLNHGPGPITHRHGRHRKRSLIAERAREKFQANILGVTNIYQSQGYHAAVQHTLHLGYDSCSVERNEYRGIEQVIITVPEEGIDSGHEELLFTMKFM